jgi:hypothetical protein
VVTEVCLIFRVILSHVTLALIEMPLKKCTIRQRCAISHLVSGTTRSRVKYGYAVKVQNRNIFPSCHILTNRYFAIIIICAIHFPQLEFSLCSPAFFAHSLRNLLAAKKPVARSGRSSTS